MTASFNPDREQIRQREWVIANLVHAIETNLTIRLPDFDPVNSVAADEFALTTVGIEKNSYGGIVESFRYQFEGEEDLLHLIVTRSSGEPLSSENAHQVASFLLTNIPTALVWFRPGTYSHHFYLGHEDFLAAQLKRL